MVYKSLNGLAPDYLSFKFVDRSSGTNYSSRDTEGPIVENTRLLTQGCKSRAFSLIQRVLWTTRCRERDFLYSQIQRLIYMEEKDATFEHMV